METTAMRDETRRPMVERVPPAELRECRQGTVANPTSVIQEFIRRVGALLSRTAALGDKVEALADRAVGSSPTSPSLESDMGGAPVAPYGGQFSELFYATSALETRMARLEAEVERLTHIA